MLETRGRAASSIGKIKLLSVNDITRMKDDFREDAEKCQEDAIRLHHNI